MIQKTNNTLLVKKAIACLLLICFSHNIVHGQRGGKTKKSSSVGLKAKGRVLFGQASFYANKFHGRRTANGETFSQAKLTAACNVLPLGTWVKVTNLKNGKTVVVKTNDRLHPNTRRIIDLTRSAATRLGFVSRGLTRVKIEVLDGNTGK